MLDLPEANLYFLDLPGRKVVYQSVLWEIQIRPGRAWMFCHRKDDRNWKSNSKLRLSMNVRFVAGIEGKNLIRWWCDIAQIMQMFAYGAMSGWNLIIAGDEHDDLIVHEHIPENEWGNLRAIRDRLEMTPANLRDMTKVDVLSFAVDRYREQGARVTLKASELREQHALRVLVDDDLIKSCVEDMAREGWLDCTELGGVFSVVPSRVSDAREEIERRESPIQQLISRVGVENGWSGSSSSSAMTARVTKENVQNVFVVHGHDEAKRRELCELLEKKLSLTPIVMQDQPGQSRTFNEKFEQIASTCEAAIAILTPDDVVEDSKERYFQPRPNVMLELGWFIGALGRRRLLIIAKEGVQVPTDLLGIEQVPFKDNIAEKFLKIQREIKAWNA